MAKEPHYRPYGWRAKLGLIVPPTNTVNEAEWVRMLPAGVTLHTTRMPLHADTTSGEGKARLFEDVRLATTELAKASVDVIAYGCTAGSMVTPLDSLTRFMQEVSGTPAVATAPALIYALRALSAKRVALATPYHDSLNEHEKHFFAECDIQTVSMRGLGIGAGGPHEYMRIARVPSSEVYAHCEAADHPEAQALVISCTDFAALGAIPVLERTLGKPVISSNLATFWLALRTAGIDDKITNFGSLLTLPTPRMS